MNNLIARLMLSTVLGLVICSISLADQPANTGGNLEVITSVPRTMVYQGILNDSGGDPVADSVYNVTFRIFNTDIGGTSLWDETIPCTTSTGLFYAEFSNVNLPFNEDYWLELEVDLEILDPRQKMHMVGYAAAADTADFALNSAGGGWVDDGTIVRLQTNTDSVGIGTATPDVKLHIEGDIYASGTATIGSSHQISGTGNTVLGYNHHVDGNSNTISGGSGIYIENNNNTIGGGYSNEAYSNGVTVGGGVNNTAGGPYSVIGGGQNNSAYGDWGGSTVGGGIGNTASGDSSTIAGGNNNTAGGTNSFVGGGTGNTAYGIGASITGGSGNATGANYSAVAGGSNNTAGGSYNFIGGGFNNNATGDNDYMTIGGGLNNHSESYAGFIGGGGLNTIVGNYAVTGGGYNNYVCGDYSVVAGGFANTIDCSADYSYLFGIGSILTQDSTFMVDMPHIRFGKESGGYEFPSSDGSNGQLMATDGNGQLAWTTISEGSNWNWSDSSSHGPDSVLFADTSYYSYDSNLLDGMDSSDFANSSHDHDTTYVNEGQANSITGSMVVDETITSGDILNGSIAFIDIGSNGASNGQIMKWNGTAWAAADDSVGGGTGGWADDGAVVRLETSTDSVGIGTSTPTEKLDVVGNIKSSGTITSGSSITIDGNSNTITSTSGAISFGDENLSTTGKATIGPGNSNSGIDAFVAGNNNTAGGHSSAIGGGSNNSANGNNSIVGGGESDTANAVYGGVLSGYSNFAGNGVLDTAAVVSGGYNNSAKSKYSTVSGGQNNAATNIYATIGGGLSNWADNQGVTIGGGWENTANGGSSNICGGSNNTSSSAYCTVGGGYNNTASGSNSNVCGGGSNTSSNTYSTVGGGHNNLSSGYCSYVPGGCGSMASGDYSVALGSGSMALHDGSLVWADASSDDFASTNENQIMMLASGGTWIYADPELLAGVTIHPGASAWSTFSDVNMKENLNPVDGKGILQKISSLPISEWNLKAQSENIRHIGPTAQDFHSTFGLGESDLTISTVDADGVALAGVKELIEIVNELRAENKELKSRIEELETKIK